MLERPSDLSNRLDALSARLEAIERRLGMTTPVSPEAVAPQPVAHVPLAPRVITPPPLPVEAQLLPPRFPAPPAPTQAPSQAALQGALQSALAARHPRTIPPAVPSNFVEDAPDGPQADQPKRSIESVVGIKWAAVGGAIFVLIAIGLFLKLGYDNGWMGRIPLSLRCAIGAAIGFVLIGAGEWARRKINAWAAVGLFAAGVAGIYASVYAAYSFSVISATPAFILLVLAAALGIFIGARTKLASVAIVSIIGGYLAPLLLQTPNPSPFVFPSYSLMLLATGLWLAAWLRANFRWVGRVAWWATLVLGGVWAASAGVDAPIVALVFLSAAWAFTHVSHFVAARGQERIEGATDADEEVIERAELMRQYASPAAAMRAVPHLSSFSVTSWTVGLSAYLLHETVLMPVWIAPAAGVGVTAVLAHVLAGHLRVLVDRPRTDRERLGAGLLAQAGALLIAAIALAVSGQAQTVVWLGVGLAAIIAGRWILSQGLNVYGLVVLSIGTARLLTYDALTKGPVRAPVGDSIAGLHPSVWMLLCVIAAGVWITAGLVWRPHVAPGRAERAAVLPIVAGIVAVVLLMVCVLHPSANLGSIALVWIGIGAVAIAASRWVPRLALDFSGPIAAATAAAPLSIGALLGWSESNAVADLDRIQHLSSTLWLASVAPVGVHPAWLIGLLLGVVQIAGALWVRAKAQRIALTPVMLWFGAGVILATSTVEAGRSGLLLSGLVSHGWGAVAVWWTFLGSIICAWATRRTAQKGIAFAWMNCAAALVILAALPWAVGFLPSGVWSWYQHTGLLHPGLVVALLIVAGCAMCARLAWPAVRAMALASRAVTIAVVSGGVLLFFVSTTLEIARGARQLASDRAAQGGAVSTWWAVFAVGLIVAGFARKVPWSRYVGLGLLCITAVKILALDMSEVPPVWRILSVAVTGLLMLGVAVLYAKLTAAIKK